MTVTRQRLTSPPEPAAAQLVASDSKAEARQDRDRVKVVGYFAARAGQWRTITQTVAGTRLPRSRVFAALDRLVEDGWLTKENEHPTPAGTTAAWIRLDPTSRPEAGR